MKLLRSSVWILAALLGCGPSTTGLQGGATTAIASSAPAVTADAPSSSTPADPAAVSATPAAASPAATVVTISKGHVRGELREGSSCQGYGGSAQQDPEHGVQVKGQTVVQTFSTGCGCPTGPHYVLLYEKTSPLRVRLCSNPDNDYCEAACFGDLEWNLARPMAAAGASAIEIVR